jgi:hypothetical protein
MKIGDLVRVKRHNLNALGLCVSYDYHMHGTKTKIWHVELLIRHPMSKRRYLEEELEIVNESR